MITPQPLLEIVDLEFRYGPPHQGLRRIHLQVFPGEKVGLVGANGAGKTTLFMAICGLLQPQQGHIILGDRPVKKGEFRPEIGLIFQNPADQLFSNTVWEDVAFGAENLGLSPEEVGRRVAAVMAMTDITALKDCAPYTLSGGQQCMVAIATVLVMEPQLILFDEPSANLDLKARRSLIRFLQESQETLMIASHDLDLIATVCDRLVIMDQGAIVADGDPRMFLQDSDLMARHHLEVPACLRSPEP